MNYKYIFNVRCEDWVIQELEIEESISNFTKISVFIDPNKNIKILQEIVFKISTIEMKLIITNIREEKERMLVILHHKSYLLSLQEGYNIFYNKNLSQILKEILSKVNIDFKLCQEPSLIKEINIRYGETLLNFLNRILNFYDLYWKAMDDGSLLIGKINDLIENLQNTNFLNKIVYQNLKEITKEILYYDEDRPNIVSKKGRGDYSIFAIDKNITLDNINDNNSMEIISEDIIRPFNKIDQYIAEKVNHYINHSKDQSYFNKVLFKQKISKLFFIKPQPLLQKGFVNNPDQKEIFLEKNNRVFISLYFDKDSIAIPVPIIQDIASENVGSFFIPRHGEEVVVDFLNQDSSYPIIIGSLYNKKNTNKFKEHECGWYMNILDSKDNKNSLIFDNKKEGNFKIDINGDFFINVEKNNMETIIKNGNINQDIYEGSYQIKINKGNMSIKLTKGDILIENHSNINIETKNLNLKAENIKIDSQNINMISNKGNFDIKNLEINSSIVKIISDISTEIKSNIINISAKAQLLIKSILISIQSDGVMQIVGKIILLSSQILNISSPMLMAAGIIKGIHLGANTLAPC